MISKHQTSNRRCMYPCYYDGIYLLICLCTKRLSLVYNIDVSTGAIITKYRDLLPLFWSERPYVELCHIFCCTCILPFNTIIFHEPSHENGHTVLLPRPRPLTPPPLPSPPPCLCQCIPALPPIRFWYHGDSYKWISTLQGCDII